MSDYFLGEIRIFGMNWAPQYWHICDGSLLQIQQNAALYSLIGTQFGGDGKTTFALPDLRGRAIIGATPGNGSPTSQGKALGTEAVTINANQVPLHTHTFIANMAQGLTGGPSAGDAFCVDGGNDVLCYGAAAPLVQLNAAACGSTGSGAPYNNMKPSLVVNYCIAIGGLYPSRP